MFLFCCTASVCKAEKNLVHTQYRTQALPVVRPQESRNRYAAVRGIGDHGGSDRGEHLCDAEASVLTPVAADKPGLSTISNAGTEASASDPRFTAVCSSSSSAVESSLPTPKEVCLSPSSGGTVAQGARPRMLPAAAFARDVRSSPLPRRGEASSTESKDRSRRRHMRMVSDVSSLYTFGAEAISSVHRGVRLRRAVDNANGRSCIVKIRIREEMIRSISHWLTGNEFVLNLPQAVNVAEVYDILQDSYGYYIVLERVSGVDLHKWATTVDFSSEALKEIIRQTLRGLTQFHDGGFIHKDIKLENLMIDSARKPGSAEADMVFAPRCDNPSSISVKIIDFDTAEPFSPNSGKVSVDVLGTNQYIAPEAYDGKYSFASDMFAVGVTAFRLLTGRYPFSGSIFNDLPGENYVGHPKMQAIRQQLRAFNIDWTHPAFDGCKEARNFVSRCLEMDPWERMSVHEALAHPWLRSPDRPDRY